MKALELAEELRIARHRARLKTTQIAAEAGIDVTALRRWERGASIPRLDHLVAWATALGKKIVLQ